MRLEKEAKGSGRTKEKHTGRKRGCDRQTYRDGQAAQLRVRSLGSQHTGYARLYPDPCPEPCEKSGALCSMGLGVQTLQAPQAQTPAPLLTGYISSTNS